MEKHVAALLWQEHKLILGALGCLVGALALKALDEYQRAQRIQSYYRAHPEDEKRIAAALNGKKEAATDEPEADH